MNPLVTIIITGTFTIASAVLTTILNARISRQRHADEIKAGRESKIDETRREIYARYLSLSESMVRQAEEFELAMSSGGKEEELTQEDLRRRKEITESYLARWDRELEPSLFEVQMFASPAVSDRAGWSAAEILNLEAAQYSTTTSLDFEEEWLAPARGSIKVLRNLMRNELDLPSLSLDVPEYAARPWRIWPGDNDSGDHRSNDSSVD